MALQTSRLTALWLALGKADCPGAVLHLPVTVLEGEVGTGLTTHPQPPINRVSVEICVHRTKAQHPETFIKGI